MTKSLKTRMLSLALILMMLAAMIPFTANAAVVIPNPNDQWSNDPDVATVKSTYEFTKNLYHAKYDQGDPDSLTGGNGGLFTSGDFSTNITFSDKKSDGNEYLSVSFSNANRTVYFALLKYGNHADMYYFPDGVTSGTMNVVGKNAISHVSFYYGDGITLRSLTISKQVTLNGSGGSYGPFAFSISFTTPASAGSFTIPTPAGATAMGSNVFTFSLNGSESISFTGIPDGSTYAVTETDSKGAASVLANGIAGVSASGTVGGTNNVTFNNIYNIPAGLTIAKAVTGNAIPQGAVFTFKLTLSNGGQPYSGNVAGATNNNDGTYTFTLAAGGSITFELPAGLAYSVEETDSRGAGSTTWSSTPSGVIPAADINNPGANKIFFTATNDFTVTGALRVIKDWEPDFELPPIALFLVPPAPPVPPVSSVTVELYEDGVATGRTLTLSAGGSEPWTGYFYDLDISKDYSVVETEVPGFSVSYSTFNGFDNDYVAEITVTNTEIPKVDAAILARKVVNGAELAAEQFTFALYQGDNRIQTATNDADGNISFSLTGLSDIPENGLVYTVREVAGSTPNWTYDTSVFTATVHADGYVTYSTQGIPTFTNTYTPPKVDATIRASKVVTGATLGAGQFTFALYQGDNQIQTATNDADGNISFSLTGLSDIPENGLVYRVREIAGNAQYWTYDRTVFIATVHADGSVTYNSGSVPTFTNTYTPPKNPPENPPFNPPQPNPVNPPIIIEEIETPLTPPEIEEEVIIPETPTPQGGAETGDNSTALFATLAAFLGLAATGAFILLRRRTKKSR